MPKMLNDGAVEYEDGTPATEAQVSWSLSFLLVNLLRCLTEIFISSFSRWEKIL